MSLPVMPAAPMPAPEALPPDPFGLWEDACSAQVVQDGGLSFDLGASGQPPAEPAPGVVWQLAISSTADRSGQGWLSQRAQQIAAIDTGLAQAGARLDTLLHQRAHQAAAGSVSFDVTGQPQAEAEMNFLLSVIEAPAGEVSFGIGDSVKALGGVNWGDLQQGLDAMLGSVTRQLMYLAWVDTTVDQRLAARTTVQWGGDLNTWLRPGLAPEFTQAHRQSLSLALTSRAANLRTVLTVAQLAGKLLAAVTTPLGAVQALSLGWQFVNDVVMPLVKKAKQ